MTWTSSFPNYPLFFNTRLNRSGLNLIERSFSNLSANWKLLYVRGSFLRHSDKNSISRVFPRLLSPSTWFFHACFPYQIFSIDVQNIFKSSQLAGQYLTGYEDYGKFFKQIATSSHQSCLILLSWEKPREITALEAVNRPARTLYLKGLGKQAAEILREKELTDEEKWSDLIAIYPGHPSWLNIIASTIVELFDSSVSRFLADKNDIYLGDLEPILESHLERLSESEKKVGYWLATQNEAVDISQQPADSELSRSDLWQAIQSLARRGLVEKVLVGGRSNFQINPVFQQYIQSK